MNKVRQFRLLILTAACCSGQLLAAEEAASDGWIFSGDIRAGWVDYDYDNPDGDPAVDKLIRRLLTPGLHMCGLQVTR